MSALAMAVAGLALNPAAAVVDVGPTFGTVAGQYEDYCFANAAPERDDDSSGPVAIPASFPITFFGNTYDTLYVNTNGNITFGQAFSGYTPSGLAGSSRPMIAPYWSDLDPRGTHTPATYGWSPDGTQFCAVWRDTGEYSYGLAPVTTQLLLTKATGSDRSAGDFDITFNYDTVQWTHGGAAVGYTAGVGLPGTFAQIGNLTDDFRDSSQSTGLVWGQRNSNQRGRYFFQIRNDGFAATLGSLHGRIMSDDPNNADPAVPVDGARVQAVLSSTESRGYTAYTTSSPTGSYRFDGLPAGTYRVTAWAPNPDITPGGVTTEVTVGGDTAAGDVILTPPAFMPSNVTLNGTDGTGSTVPTVYWGSPTNLTVDGCAATANPQYWVTLASGEEIARGPLNESPAGVFSASIPPFHPNHGGATIHTNVPRTCGGAGTEFNIYIDPSGTVVDQNGHPVQGATVTLLRSDTQNGTYTAVPDGSTIMSPSNRTNPGITGADGQFGWDVIPGWYKVTASAPDCTDGSTDVMEVPPPRLGLVIELQCNVGGPVRHPAPEPVTPPSISGTPKVGQTLTAHEGTWPEPTGVWDLSHQWLRNGTPIPGETGPTYTLRPVDEGTRIKIEVTAIRAGYENGVADSEAVTVLPADPPPPPTPTALVATTPPSISGTAAWGQTLTADHGEWDGTDVTYAYQWLRDGEPIADATSATYPVDEADVGHSLAVRVVASAPDRLDGTATTDSVAVPKVASTLTGTLTKDTVKAGKRTRLNLSLAVGAPASPVGQIRILVDGEEVKVITMAPGHDGQRKFRLPAMTAGVYEITAEFLGTGTVAPSSMDPLTLTVTRRK